MKLVPLSRPDHPDDPAALLTTLREILLSGRWTEGEFAASFESRVAEVCGSVYAVATNSGTSALEAVLVAAGIGNGCEVIVPSYTFIATVNSILSCGATPVFGDIDPKTFNLDPHDTAERVTERTKAILLVHQFGIPAQVQAFVELCRKKDMILIEDAACGLGSKYEGKALSTFGLAGLLSFHPRKVISTGEGGMVLTDDAQLAERARQYGNHGRPGKGKPATMVGHNHRMSEFQAALGIWAIEHFGEAIKRRGAISERYEQGVRELRGVTVTLEPGRGHWNRQSYPIRISSKRDHVMEALRREGIESSPGPMPAHLHRYIEHLFHPPRLPHTEAAHAETLLLPMFAALTTRDQDRVITALRDALR